MKRLVIDITSKCNLECRFCYQSSQGQLSQNEILNIVGSSGSRIIGIGGGEPLLYPDIVPLLAELAGMDKQVHISTNCTSIPEGLLELEDKVREKIQMQASLHASNPVLYHQITGEDFFYNVIQNISLLSRRFRSMISSSIYFDNYEDAENSVGLANSLNLPIRVNLVYPIGKGKNVGLLNSEQVDSLRGFLLAQYIKTNGRVNSPLVHPNTCLGLERAYGIPKEKPCFAEDLGCKKYISPDGKESACEFSVREAEAQPQIPNPEKKPNMIKIENPWGEEGK